MAGKKASCTGTDVNAVDTAFLSESCMNETMLIETATKEAIRADAQKALPTAERSLRERKPTPCKEEEERKSWRWRFKSDAHRIVGI